MAPFNSFLSREPRREAKFAEPDKNGSPAVSILSSADEKKAEKTTELSDVDHGTSRSVPSMLQKFLRKQCRRVALAGHLFSLFVWISWSSSVDGLDKNKGDKAIDFSVAAPELSLPACPDGFAFDKATFRCVQVVSHKPLKKCLLGVINENICVHFVQPISKTCPPGYHQKFVSDSTPKCAKVNYAQKLLGCHPQEEMIEGLCVRRTYKEISYVCRKGDLDENNRCILKQLLPPILKCPLGYKVIDDLCVLQRPISCVDTDAPPSFPFSHSLEREEANFRIKSEQLIYSPHKGVSNSFNTNESGSFLEGNKSPHSNIANEITHRGVHPAVSPYEYDVSGGNPELPYISVVTSTLGGHNMTSSREFDAYIALENRPLISRIENSNQESYGHSYGGDYEKNNEQPVDVFHSEELTSNGEAFGQYGILPEKGLQHSYRSHSLFTHKASRMHLYPQEDEFSTTIPVPAYAGTIRESHDQHGNNVMPLLSWSQETYIPTISLHDSSSALLLPDAPYLTEDSEWARKVQHRIPASVAASGASSVLSPFSGSADLLHRNDTSPRFLTMARKGASHREAKISGSRTETKKVVQIEGRVIPKEHLESENRVFLGKDSRKHGKTEPRRLLGGIETQSNLVDHCYETLTVEPNRGCPFDFTLEIFKDDSIKSPVLVCMGVRVLPSEALCAGKVVDSRCLVETKSHAKWFCPLDVVVEQAPDPKIKKSLPKSGEPKKTPGSHSESEKAKEGSSKQEQKEKKPSSHSASATTERSSSAAVLDASSAPRHAQGTNSTDPNVKKPGEETAKDEKEDEVGRTRHPRHRQLESVVTSGKNDKTGVSLGPWADALFVKKAEEAGRDTSALRQLGKLPFALLVMEINERRKVSDPKQRMKDEVEKMNSSRKTDVDAALHHSVPSPLPPVPPSPGQKEGKRIKDIKAKKLSDPPEPPPTGLCYREQIVDQIVVCPEGYNVTSAQACQATSQPVVTCHAGFLLLPEGVCVQYVYAELVDILGLTPSSEEKPKIVDKLKKSKAGGFRI